MSKNGHKCYIHPKYEGKGKPRSKKEGCTCYVVWLLAQPVVPVKARS